MWLGTTAVAVAALASAGMRAIETLNLLRGVAGDKRFGSRKKRCFIFWGGKLGICEKSCHENISFERTNKKVFSLNQTKTRTVDNHQQDQ